MELATHKTIQRPMRQRVLSSSCGISFSMGKSSLAGIVEPGVNPLYKLLKGEYLVDSLHSQGDSEKIKRSSLIDVT